MENNKTDITLVSDCCGTSDMIPPDWELAEQSGSAWAAFACYICKKCRKACNAISINVYNVKKEMNLPVSERYKKITRDNLEKYLLEYQLEMAGKTLFDTFDDEKWYFNITMTFAQRDAFRKHAIGKIQKTLKCNRSKALAILEHFEKNLGIRIKNIKE